MWGKLTIRVGMVRPGDPKSVVATVTVVNAKKHRTGLRTWVKRNSELGTVGTQGM